MSESSTQSDRDPVRGERPGLLVMRALASKLGREGQPRMAELHTVERNGHTYTRYRRPDQISDGFIKTSAGGDFFTRDFRGGGPRNIVANLNDEAGIATTNEVGYVRIQNTPNHLQFNILPTGELEEVVTDAKGHELSRMKLDAQGAEEVASIIHGMEPGMVWWQSGVPNFPEDR